MSIFITGATGFVGRNFLEWLLRHVPDITITCLVRDPIKADQQWAASTISEKNRIQWIPGDLLEPSTYAAEIQKAEWIFHIAALVSLRNGPEFYRANVDTTQALLNALQDSRQLKRLVFLSSISAIDRPLDIPAVGPLTEASVAHPNTDYGKSKLQAERLVSQSGLPYTTLRPAYIYGPYPRLKSSIDRLIHDIQTQAHYTRFPFPGRASEIYVEDLAEMLWVASQHSATQNETFFVGNPEPVKIGTSYSQVAKALGVPYQPMPIENQKMERFQRLLYRKYPDNLLLRVLFEDLFYCSSEKWVRLTNLAPRNSFEAGVAKTVRWFQRNGLI